MLVFKSDNYTRIWSNLFRFLNFLRKKYYLKNCESVKKFLYLDFVLSDQFTPPKYISKTCIMFLYNFNPTLVSWDDWKKIKKQ